MNTIWTIGHGDRPLDDLAESLLGNRIAVLVDVRSGRGGVRQPQFAAESMAKDLHPLGIHYFEIPSLGGRRAKNPLIDPEVNAGWQNASFHNYADHTMTKDYREGIAALVALSAGRDDVAIMCSETLPWRCHRQLIASTLVSRGHDVLHIVGDKLAEHHLGEWGAMPFLREGRLTYPRGTGE